MKKIYLIGDSISIHYTPFLSSYLNGIAELSRKEGEDEALLNLDNPQGGNGGDSSMVLDFLKAKENTGGIDADIILINCGLHDIKTDPVTLKKQVPIDHYASNLKQILTVVRRMGLYPMWIRTTPCDEKVHNRLSASFHRFAQDCIDYNQTADEIMHLENVPVIDLFTFTANLGNDLYCDHVHFRGHIREKQAAFIAGYITSIVR